MDCSGVTDDKTEDKKQREYYLPAGLPANLNLQGKAGPDAAHTQVMWLMCEAVCVHEITTLSPCKLQVGRHGVAVGLIIVAYLCKQQRLSVCDRPLTTSAMTG